MSTEELVKRLRAIEYGEGEFPLPDTMIDDIIEKLKEREEFQELHESYIDIVLDLYDQLEQKKLIAPEGFVEKRWIKFKEYQAGQHPGQLSNFLEQMINELGLEVEKK